SRHREFAGLSLVDAPQAPPGKGRARAQEPAPAMAAPAAGGAIPARSKGGIMPATSPAEICRLFRQAMAAGDIDGVLSVYDPEVVFLNRSGVAVQGKESLRAEIAPLAQAKADFAFDIRSIVEADGIALMHTHWRVSHP